MTFLPDMTIFVQIDNLKLRNEIVEWATSRGLCVFNGGGYDLIAVGYKFAIVDETVVSSTVWNHYIDYLYESEDRTPCLVINASQHALHTDIPNLYYVSGTLVVNWPRFLDNLYQRTTVTES